MLKHKKCHTSPLTLTHIHTLMCTTAKNTSTQQLKGRKERGKKKHTLLWVAVFVHVYSCKILLTLTTSLSFIRRSTFLYFVFLANRAHQRRKNTTPTTQHHTIAYTSHKHHKHTCQGVLMKAPQPPSSHSSRLVETSLLLQQIKPHDGLLIKKETASLPPSNTAVPIHSCMG